MENGISDEHGPLTIATKVPPQEHDNFDIDFGVRVEALEDNAILSKAKKQEARQTRVLDRPYVENLDNFWVPNH